jgi:hypothetical protein
VKTPQVQQLVGGIFLHSQSSNSVLMIGKVSMMDQSTKFAKENIRQNATGTHRPLNLANEALNRSGTRIGKTMRKWEYVE